MASSSSNASKTTISFPLSTEDFDSQIHGKAFTQIGILRPMFEGAMRSWSAHKVQALNDQFAVFRREIAEAGFDVRHVMQGQIKALKLIQEQAKSADSSRKHRVRVLTVDELTSQIDEFQRKVHCIATNHLKRHPSTLVTNSDFNASYNFIVNGPDALNLMRFEKEFSCGVVAMTEKNPFDQTCAQQLRFVGDDDELLRLAQEKDNSSVNSTELYFESQQIRTYALRDASGNFNLEMLNSIEKGFTEKIEQCHRYNFSAFKVYRDFVIVLNQLQIEVSKLSDVANAQEFFARFNQLKHTYAFKAHEEFSRAQQLNKNVEKINALDFSKLGDECKGGNIEETLDLLEASIRLTCLRHNQVLEKLAFDQSEDPISATEALELILELYTSKVEEYNATKPFLAKRKDPKLMTKWIQKFIQFHIDKTIEFAESSRSPIEPLIMKKDSPVIWLTEVAQKLGILETVIPRETLRSLFVTMLVNTTSAFNVESRKNMALQAAPDENSMRNALELQRLRKRRQRLSMALEGDPKDRVLSVIANQEQESLGQAIKECQDAIGVFSRLDTDLVAPKNRKVLKQAAADLNEINPNFLFYLSLLPNDIPKCFSYLSDEVDPITGKPTEVVVLEMTDKQVDLLEKITKEYILNIRPHQIATKTQSELAPLMLGATAAEKTQNLGKLQSTFVEMASFGLRFYHSQLGVLTSFLEWPDTKMEKLFTDHLIMRDLKSKRMSKASRQTPSGKEISQHKSSLAPARLEAIEKQAATEANRFKALLTPFRTLRSHFYNFMNNLVDIIFKQPNYLDCKSLSYDDIVFLEDNKHIFLEAEQTDAARSADCLERECLDMLSPAEQAAVTAVIPHLNDLKKYLQNHGAGHVFFKETLDQGVPLIFKKANPVLIKLAVQILKLFRLKNSVNSINIEAFNELFSTKDSSWEKYVDRTISLATNSEKKALENYCSKFEFMGLNPLDVNFSEEKNGGPEGRLSVGDYSCAMSSFDLLWESPHQNIAKWPLFAADASKRFEDAADSMGDFIRVAQASCRKYNLAVAAIQESV